MLEEQRTGLVWASFLSTYSINPPKTSCGSSQIASIPPGNGWCAVKMRKNSQEEWNRKEWILLKTNTKAAPGSACCVQILWDCIILVGSPTALGSFLWGKSCPFPFPGSPYSSAQERLTSNWFRWQVRRSRMPSTSPVRVLLGSCNESLIGCV